MQQQHSFLPFFPSLPASLPETTKAAEEPYITTIIARTIASASASSAMVSQSATNPNPITTTMHARKLLEQHLGSTLSPTSSPPSSPKTTGKISSNRKKSCSHHYHRNTSALPEDGVLWSKGTRKIRLLEDMSSSLIPITSYSLFPNAEDDAFGAPSLSVANAPKRTRNTTTTGTIIEPSTTIGYTQQQVGHLTILRPIVLLPGRFQSHGSTNDTVTTWYKRNKFRRTMYSCITFLLPDDQEGRKMNAWWPKTSLGSIWRLEIPTILFASRSEIDCVICYFITFRISALSPFLCGL